jgi:hypothetical protein
MVNGGGRQESGDAPRDPSRSRTTLVMDQLLSRGPLLSRSNSETTGGPGPPDPWASVSGVLLAADPRLVANHLAWLVFAVHGEGSGSSSGQVEDQIRILVRALDERHQHDLLVEALDQTPPWTADAVTDDDETIIGYASDLTTATDGHPEDSPYVALAATAVHWATGILDHRGSSVAHRRRA